MEKTILNLNNKAWYRLIKVIFIIVFVITISIGNYEVFQNKYNKLDLEKSTLTCNRSTGKVTYKLNELSIYYGLENSLKNYNYKTFYSEPSNEYAIENILKKCNSKFTANISIYDLQRYFDIKNDEPLFDASNDDQKWQNRIDQEKSINSPISYTNHLFDITPVYSSENFLKSFLLTNIIIILIFVFIQRIFYYIVLGSIKPKK
ncbi:hypothetical protein KKH39_01610 [Patescibacteria group bacterium]|nr:hypothetical protein [Patescibacteria group bacterium]